MSEPFTFWRVCFKGGSAGFEIVNCTVGAPQVDLTSGSLMVPWVAQDHDHNQFQVERYYPMSAIAYWEKITLPVKPPDFGEQRIPESFFGPFPPTPPGWPS